MIAAVVFALAATVFSGRENQLRVPPPRVDTAAPMTIDGVLDEDAWQQAAVLTGFSQYSPVDGRPAENATEVLVFYSPRRSISASGHTPPRAPCTRRSPTATASTPTTRFGFF
jgi:hypothetical protein